MTSFHDELDKCRVLAEQLIQESRKIIASKIESGFSFHRKADLSLVTEVDTEIELHFRKRIAEAFPSHRILGEEYGKDSKQSKWEWILDPIDGTLSFRHGIPLYGTLIAVRHEKEGVIGIIDLPGIDRTLIASTGNGAYCNGNRITIEDVSSVAEIRESEMVIATSDRANFLRSSKTSQIDELAQLHPRLRSYSDCFGHALAVLGNVGAMIDFNICLWDIAASEVLIKEAGGLFAVVERIEHPDLETRYSVIMGKPTVVKWLLPFFKAGDNSQVSFGITPPAEQVT